MLTDGTSSFSTDKVAKAQPFHRPKNDFTGHRSITFKIRQHFGSQCQVNSRGQGKSIQPHRGRKSADIRTGVQRWPTHDWPCVFGISSLFGVHSAATRCSPCRYSVFTLPLLGDGCTHAPMVLDIKFGTPSSQHSEAAENNQTWLRCSAATSKTFRSRFRALQRLRDAHCPPTSILIYIVDK